MVNRLKRLSSYLKEHSEGIKSVLKLLEVQVLVFPVLVVLLACISFFFGGCCAAWQWWTAVVMALVIPILSGKSSKLALYTDVLFIVLLLLGWCVAPMVYDSCNSPDCALYHLPQIRLLIAGWNPVLDPTAENIVSALGLDLDGMSYYHVAYLSKVAAIFSAVSFNFIRDPYALTYPVVFFLFISTILISVRACRAFSSIIGVFAVMLLWHWTDSNLYVDASIKLASAGLLFTMFLSLKENRLYIIQLVVFSFWLMNLKMPGLIAAFLFWAVFVIVYLWRNREQFLVPFSKVFGVAVTMIVLLCIASFSPYGTSFRDTGHPLYPFMSIDEDKYPVRKLTWDFKIGNADYDEMGYWGEFLNAYTAPKLVREYYNRKLGRTDFKPHKYIWDYSFADTNVMYPLSLRQRGLLWLSIMTLLAFPSFRAFGVMMLACLFIFPREYMGFLRYQPWLDVFAVLAIVAIISHMFEKCGKRYIKMPILFLLIAFCGLQFCRGFIAKTATIYAKHIAVTHDVDSIYTCCMPPASRIPLGYESSAGERHAYGGVLTGRYVNNFRLLLNSVGKYGVAVNVLPDGMAEGFKKSVLGYYYLGGLSTPQRHNWRTKMALIYKVWSDYYFDLLTNRF